MVERLGRRLARSILLWDLLLTLLALYSASSLRLWLDYGNYITEQQVLIPWQVAVAVVTIWTVVFLLLTPQRALFLGTFAEAMGRLLGAVTLASLAFAGMLFLSFRDISRLQFLYFTAIDLSLLLILHVVVRIHFRSQSRSQSQRRTLIVGSGPQAEHVVREFQRRPWAGMNVVGFNSDAASELDILPVFGTVEQTASVVEAQAIDEVVFVGLPSEEVARISLQLVHYPVMLHMVPGLLDWTFARTPVESLGGIPLISLRESALSESQRALKRLFDVLGSLLLLVLLSPLILITAVLIKLESPGSVFFRQERIGEQGRRFRMIKFRSMYRDAEQRWREVAIRDSDGRLVHKRSDDPRITRVGRVLRRTSLDELPQLLNVLRGEMSLVGPRPEMPYVAKEYEPWQWQRVRIPPGMTGWWQVSGRSDKLMHLHTEDDLYYIQNYSFWLDLKILWKTLGAVAKRQGAY